MLYVQLHQTYRVFTMKYTFIWSLFVLAQICMPVPIAAESLLKQLEALSENSKSKIPAKQKEIMASAEKQLSQTDILSGAPTVGSVLPDGVLLSTMGESTTLYQALGSKPAIVTFYRGGWCPYCNLQLHAYQKHLSTIHDLGATLIAISPELPDNTLSTKEKNELTFTVLSDTNNSYAKKIGIVFSLPTDLENTYSEFGIDLKKNQGNRKAELPLAATFVIDSRRTIRYAFIDTDYKKRAEPATLIKILEGLRIHTGRN